MHPMLFHIGDFYIGTYGLFVTAGLLTAIFWSARRARAAGLNADLILDLAFFGVLAGLVGSRITYILVNWGDFAKTFSAPGRSPMEYVLTRQGFVFAGGMVIGVLTAVAYLRHKRAPLWRVADIAAPTLPLGHGIGRIGCFFAGCCYGDVCEVPWGVRFPRVIGPNGEVLGFAHADHVHQGLIPPSSEWSLPVHPTQLYEAATLFLISGVLFWLARRRRFEGQLFIAYIALYSIARIGLEFLRGDVERGVYFGVSTSQWISIAVIIVAAVLWFARWNSGAPVHAPAPAPANANEPASRRSGDARQPQRSRRRDRG